MHEEPDPEKVLNAKSKRVFDITCWWTKKFSWMVPKTYKGDSGIRDEITNGVISFALSELQKNGDNDWKRYWVPVSSVYEIITLGFHFRTHFFFKTPD